MRSALAALAILTLALRPARAEDAAKSEIRFLDTQQAAAAIADDSKEGYFSLLQTAEITAKTGIAPTAKTLPEQREECRKRYQVAVLEFTEAERTAITAAAMSVSEGLEDAYPLFARTPWVFLKVNDSIEGAMPFTRGDAIVFSASVAKVFTRAKNPAKSGLLETLVHEQSHVLQRTHPDLFESFYTKEWGFARAKGLRSCAWLDEVQILNPDGVDTGWVFPERNGASTAWWQPMVVLREGIQAPRMPQDFQISAFEVVKDGTAFQRKLDKDGKPVRASLSSLAAFQDAFGMVDENFHPNEIFAVLFGRLAMQENLSAKATATEPELVKVREWCAKNFAISK